MNQETRAFLEANRHHWDLFSKVGILKHLDAATRERMVKVIRENFSPGYTALLWCPTCVADMIQFLYTQYDKMLEDEKLLAEKEVMTGEEVPQLNEGERIEKMTFPAVPGQEEKNKVKPQANDTTKRD